MPRQLLNIKYGDSRLSWQSVQNSTTCFTHSKTRVIACYRFIGTTEIRLALSALFPHIRYHAHLRTTSPSPTTTKAFIRLNNPHTLSLLLQQTLTQSSLQPFTVLPAICSRPYFTGELWLGRALQSTSFHWCWVKGKNHLLLPCWQL